MTQSLTELHLLAQLDHPCIIQVYGLVIDRYDLGQLRVACFLMLLACRLPLTFAMERCPYGDLRAQLLATQARLPLDVELEVFKQLAAALAYLHGKRILHRDLAARNVLVKGLKPYMVKLADFGCKILAACLRNLTDMYRML